MEYQDYNDEFHRYRTDGYVKTVRDKRRYYERIIRNYKLGDKTNKEQLNENTYRMIYLEEQINILGKELYKMNQKERTEINLLKQNKIARDLIQYRNEKDIIKTNIMYLKHSGRQIKKWIREEQEMKSKLVIF